MSRLECPQPEIHLTARCYDCRKYHEVRASADSWLARMEDWRQKHLGHRIEFVSPQRNLLADCENHHKPSIFRRLTRHLDRLWERFGVAPWWLGWQENVDIKIAYATGAAYTISLASLASSATLVAGQESTAVSNTTNLYLDYLVGGKVTTGTTPTTAKTIQIWAYGSLNDTPTYPDVMDGTDSAETVTSGDIRNAGLNFFADTATDSTSDRGYWFRPMSLAAVFGGVVPKNHGLWVTHDTAVALNATAGNHVLNHTGAYATG